MVLLSARRKKVEQILSRDHEGTGPWPLVLAGPALSLGILVDDAVLIPRVRGYLGLALLDEPAHLATTAVGLLAACFALPAHRSGGGPWFVAGALMAGNLIDVDHVPLMLGHDFLTAGTPRPYPHSLATVLVLLVLATVTRGRWRRVLAGSSLGVLLHLFRDIATGQVSLLWPLTTEPVHLAYAVYALGLGVLALIPTVPALVCWLLARR